MSVTQVVSQSSSCGHTYYVFFYRFYIVGTEVSYVTPEVYMRLSYYRVILWTTPLSNYMLTIIIHKRNVRLVFSAFPLWDIP
jgi:hypothetical protein